MLLIDCLYSIDVGNYFLFIQILYLNWCHKYVIKMLALVLNSFRIVFLYIFLNVKGSCKSNMAFKLAKINDICKSLCDEVKNINILRIKKYIIIIVVNSSINTKYLDKKSLSYLFFFLHVTIFYS